VNGLEIWNLRGDRNLRIGAVLSIDEQFQMCPSRFTFKIRKSSCIPLQWNFCIFKYTLSTAEIIQHWKDKFIL